MLVAAALGLSDSSTIMNLPKIAWVEAKERYCVELNAIDPGDGKLYRIDAHAVPRHMSRFDISEIPDPSKCRFSQRVRFNKRHEAIAAAMASDRSSQQSNRLHQVSIKLFKYVAWKYQAGDHGNSGPSLQSLEHDIQIPEFTCLYGIP